MRIDDIAVGESYAYSWRSTATTDVEKITVLSIDSLPSKRPGGSVEHRNQRYPYVLFEDGGRKEHVVAARIIEPWDSYASKAKVAQDRLRTAERLERRATKALKRHRVAGNVNMETILSQPRDLVIRVPFGNDGVDIERLIELLEGT